jgi:hypothetical protein
MANIVVDNIDLKFSSEMGFNDLPKRVDATITIKMARPFGQQEINRMFNNQYGRIYSKSSGSTESFTGGTLPEVEIVAKKPTTTTNPPPTGTKIVGRGNNQKSFFTGT